VTAEIPYRIIIKGVLSDRLSAAFEGMRLEPGDGTTTIVADSLDQSALFGVIERIRSLGLELVGLELGNAGARP
jgi:hypothetical protein